MELCKPDFRRAKGIHAGGCPHPTFCMEKGKCYYGVGETFDNTGMEERCKAVGLDVEPERPVLAKRPVAWRVVHPDGFVELFQREETADFVAERSEAKCQGLYVRDGT